MAHLGVHEDGPRSQVPLVLLHAFPFDHRMWSPVRDVLADMWTITIDAPGFGDSGNPRVLGELIRDSRGGIAEFADDIAAWARSRGLEKLVVAGVSMGGYITLALAERHPDVLAGIALIDTKASADDDAAAEGRRQMAADARRGVAFGLTHMAGKVLAPDAEETNPQLYTQVVRWIGQAPFIGLEWAQESMAARPDRLDALRGLDIPAAVIRGENDQLASLADHEAMAQALGCEVTTVSDAGHLSPVEQPEAVSALLRSLVERAQPA